MYVISEIYPFYMKTTSFILSAILLISGASAIQAQETSHLKFKQVEIHGNSAQFLSRLEDDGFIVTGEKGDEVLSGIFAGQKVQVSIEKTSISGIVYQVLAMLDARSKWNMVEEDYLTFKTNLIKKYGDPDICKERFVSPYRKGDGYEKKAMESGKVEYLSCWIVPEGEITIQIVAVRTDLALLIRYVDAEGMRLQEKEKSEIILRDL